MHTALERHPSAPGVEVLARAGLAASSQESAGDAAHAVRGRSARVPLVRCTRHTTERTGFLIGWDYAAHGLPLPDGAPEPVVQGHAVAAPRFRTPKTHDRFVRKWLLLRHNAWLRGRIVSDEITPAYLQTIDAVRCPVTRTPLTHGTGADTDWSVDRLNNDAGYVPGNLAVISARANRAKGTKGFPEVSALAALGTASGGLAAAEWSRLASLMLGPCFAEVVDSAPLHPLVALSPGTVRTGSQQLQLALLVHRDGGVGCSLGKLRSLSAAVGGAQTFHRLVKRIRRQCERGQRVSEVFLDAHTFELFAQWFGALQKHRVVGTAESITARTLERALRPCVYGGAWGLDSLGYEVER